MSSMTRRTVPTAALLCGACAAAAQPCTPQWTPTFPYDGVGGIVFGSTIFDEDGPGPGKATLFASGRFTTAGGLPAERVARFDGKLWSEVGGGVGSAFNDTAYALAVFDEDGGGGAPPALFACGDFTVAGGNAAARIARWDGETWTSVGGGMNDIVREVTVIDDGSGPALYAGGFFTTAGGSPASRIAKWNGQAWTTLGAGVNAAVRAVCRDPAPGVLYVGGGFTMAGGAPANHVAKWTGSAWQPLGQGLSGEVRSLVMYNDGSGERLYAGGDFPGGAIASWNGATWQSVGGGVPASLGIRMLLPFDDDGPGPHPTRLFAAGGFTSIGGVLARSVAAWNGSAWEAIGTGVNGLPAVIWTLCPYDRDGPGPDHAHLVAGGEFESAGDVSRDNIAQWDGDSWSGLAGGMAGYTIYEPSVNALASFDEDSSGPEPESLFVGGKFAMVGDIPTKGLARWDGTAWSTVGSGLGSSVQPEVEVHALLKFDDGTGAALYVGGYFNEAAGAPTSPVSRWDGESWSALGPPVIRTVEALAAHDDGSGAALYAAGSFESIGGVFAERIARWDGTA